MTMRPARSSADKRSAFEHPPRRGFGGHSAFAVLRMQMRRSVPVRLRFRFAQATPDTLRPDGLRLVAPRAAHQGEAWWGKKDSNLRSHKTADLQSAPFATRDTPPLNPIASPPAGMATDTAMDDVKTGRRWRTPSRAVYGGIAMAKSTNGRRLIRAARGSNCHNAEPVTQACHGRS
jgi:hypothetical protein